MKQALESAVQKAGVARVVETAPNSCIGGPMGINRPRVEGFGGNCSILCGLGSFHRRSSWPLGVSRLRHTCQRTKDASNAGTLTSATAAATFGLGSLIGWYFPSATAKTPEEEPSMNSIGGGKSLLKASRSFAGR